MSDRPSVISSEVFERGALRSSLVSRLSGATARQLGYWHSTELLAATVVPGRRGVPRLYSWIDYSKARAAAKLLRRGLPSVHLRANIAWLEDHLPYWYTLPLTAFQGSVIVTPPGGEPSYTIGEIRQRAAAEFIEAAPLATQPAREYGHLLTVESVSPYAVREALSEMSNEGPLGALFMYRDVVDMDPRIRAGSPIVRGTRIETEFLAVLRQRGEPTASIADRFELDPVRVERALEFEFAIAA